jgi:hypothetical protein
MALLLLSIGFLQNIMDLLEDVLNLLNESGAFVGLRMNMGRFCLSDCKRECNINGTQGLKSLPHLKWSMVGGAMESLFVAILNIWKTLIQCMWMLRVLHEKDVHIHLIEDLFLVSYLGVKSNGFCELGVQQ